MSVKATTDDVMGYMARREARAAIHMAWTLDQLNSAIALHRSLLQEMLKDNYIQGIWYYTDRYDTVRASTQQNTLDMFPEYAWKKLL